MSGTIELFDLYASLRRAIALEASQAFKDIGLGTRQFIMLWSLNRNKRMNVSDLVEAAMTDAATVSRSLVQLIKNGYVKKIQCAKDGRVWYVELTPKGLSLAPEMERLYRGLANRCFSVLKSEEREALGSILAKVVGNLETDSHEHNSAPTFVAGRQ